MPEHKISDTLEVFAGEPHSMWHAASHTFPMWNWTFETDLPPFLRETFPDERIPHDDTELTRELLVKLDRRYFLAKRGAEHPKYKWGRYERSVSWAKSPNGSYCFALEPESQINEISRAYKAAKSARFEYVESGGHV